MIVGKAASFFFLCKITLLEYGERTKHRGAGLKWHSIKGGDRSDRLQLAAKKDDRRQAVVIYKEGGRSLLSTELKKQLTCQEFGVVASSLLNATSVALRILLCGTKIIFDNRTSFRNFPLTMDFVEVFPFSVTGRHKRPHECPRPKFL